MINEIINIGILIFLIGYLGIGIVVGVFCRYMSLKHSTVITIVTQDDKLDNNMEISEKPTKEKIFPIFSYIYGLTCYYSILIGKIPSQSLRKFLYRNILCMDIHKDAVIYGGCEIRSPWNVKIGKCAIGRNCILDGRFGIRIEDGSTLGSEVNLWTAQHNVNDQFFRTINKTGSIIISRHAWVASRSTVLPNKIIEEGAVIASGAVVTQNCKAFNIYGGVPAKVISKRICDLKYEATDNYYWRFY